MANFECVSGIINTSINQITYVLIAEIGGNGMHTAISSTVMKLPPPRNTEVPGILVTTRCEPLRNIDYPVDLPADR